MGLQNKIAKVLEKIDEPCGEEWDKIEYTPYKEMYLRRADKVLAKIREVVEGIENPYFKTSIFGGSKYLAFEEARQAILKAMED